MEPSPDVELTQDEIDAAIPIFKKIGAMIAAKQRLPSALYELQLPWRQCISTEVAFLNSRGEVFLARRPPLAEDPAEPYPGLLHSLGVTHRTENGTQAMLRLLEMEVGADVTLDGPHRVVELDIPPDARGIYEMRIHIARVTCGTIRTKGEFYDWCTLDYDELVWSHKAIILPIALGAAAARGWISPR